MPYMRKQPLFLSGGMDWDGTKIQAGPAAASLSQEHLIFRISAGSRKALLMIPCTRQIYFNKFNVDLIYSILLRRPG